SRRGAEVHPTEHEREGDRDPQQAPPEQTLVHPPAQRRSPPDEALREQLRPRRARDPRERAQPPPFPRDLPPAPPEHPGGRLRDPDEVVVENTPRCEDDSEC